MSRLFRAHPEAHDLRPTVMSIAGLMLLLLPLTLVSTSIEKRTGLAIGLSGGSGDQLQSDGPVQSLLVRRTGDGFVVLADVRTTDVRSAATERRSLAAADLGELQTVLARLKRIDPDRTELTLAPHPSSTTAQVVAWMDAVRIGPSGPLFPKIVLAVDP